MRSREESEIWAYSENGRVKFPAFVRLPASALPYSRRSLCSNDADFVKCIAINAIYSPQQAGGSRDNFRRMLAQRWRILEDQIRAITVNLDGVRVLIETDEDWQEWVSAFFHRSRSSSNPRDDHVLRNLTIEPVHIHIIIDEDFLISGAPAGTSVRSANAPPTYTEVTAPRNASSAPTVEDLISRLTQINADVRAYYQASQSAAGTPSVDHHAPQQQRAEQGLHDQGEGVSQPPTAASSQQRSSQTLPPVSPTASSATTAMPEDSATPTLASSVVGSVLQALQPQLLQGLSPAIATILSNVATQLAHPPAATSSSAASDSAANTSGRGMSVPLPGDAAGASAPVGSPQPSASASATQRQSLMEGMFDELSRLRAQPSSAPAPRPPQSTAQPASTSEDNEGAMTNELGQAFAEMLARQRSTADTATAAAPTAEANESEEDEQDEDYEEDEEDEEDEDESTSSTSADPSRRSSRSSRRAFLSTTTLTLFTLFTFLLAFVSPAFASPSAPLASLNPTTNVLYPREVVAPR